MDQKSVIVIAIIAVFAIGIAMFTIKGFSDSTGNAVVKIDSSEVKEFTLKAFRFGYEPSELRVKRGEKIKIIIDNTDTIHGIRLPDFGVSGKDQVEFIPDKTGSFKFYCDAFCGSGHSGMSGTLIVE